MYVLQYTKPKPNEIYVQDGQFPTMFRKNNYLAIELYSAEDTYSTRNLNRARTFEYKWQAEDHRNDYLSIADDDDELAGLPVNDMFTTVKVKLVVA